VTEGGTHVRLSKRTEIVLIIRTEEPTDADIVREDLCAILDERGYDYDVETARAC
jgi:hypothetical protein